jgi:Signal transduction histidine kinase regulating C4-dicarboxylate transport system
MFKSDAFSRRVPRIIWHYGLAAASVAMALAVTQSLERYTTLRTPLFFAAILISAWVGGIGPGLLAVGLATLAIGYYFDPPKRLPPESLDLPFLIAFTLLALVITWISAKRKGMEDALKRAHHELEAKVEERTADLQRTNKELQTEITERKHAEEELQQAQAELAHVTRLTTLGELTASIAHEVNQPLAAVSLNANACLRWLGGEAPNLHESHLALQRIIKEAERASEVIGRIRALAKKTPPRKDRVDINEVLLEVIALARSELRRNRVELQTQLADGLPLALADRVQLQQVILNLIINGVEAMNGVSGGRRELLVRSAKHEDAGMLVAVRDSGAGLDSASFDQIFNPFYTTKPNGMGMGLTISRSIIEAHGGRLWATANAPRGAIFQFTLPIDGEE